MPRFTAVVHFSHPDFDPVAVWVDADDIDSAENHAFAHFEKDGQPVVQVEAFEGETDPSLNLNVI